MKTLAKIFNTLTICSMSGIGCVPMAANFNLNSNKNFNINAKHNSLTTQQIKDESGIDVDDYQSMMLKYIEDNSQQIDDMATSWLNQNNKEGKTIELYQCNPDDAKFIAAFWQFFFPNFKYTSVKNDKKQYTLTFKPKSNFLKQNLLIKRAPIATQDDFEISIENGLNAGYLDENAQGEYKVPHFNSPKLYRCVDISDSLQFSNFFRWDKNIPDDCFKISTDGKNIIFDPKQMSKKYYEDSFWTAGIVTNQVRTCHTGDKGEAPAKWWTLSSQLVNPNNNKIWNGFKYNPSQLFQFDKVGLDKEKNRIYSQSSLNKHLLKVALSTEFNQEFIDPNNNWNIPWLDIEASGTSTITKDGKIIPNQNTLIHLENTQYWGTMLGQKDPVAGGLDLWFPIGDTGQKDAQGKPIMGLKDFKGYTQPEYLETVNKVFSKLKDYANPNYNGTNSMCLTYDNYFKLRDWCWKYCTSGSHIMPTTDQDPNTSILAALNSNDLTNSDWVQWKNGSLNAGTDNDPILVDPKNVDYLEQLAITLKAIKFDEWNNYDSTGLGTTSGNWDNPLENQYLGKDNEGFKDIINSANKKYYDNVPSDKNTPIIVTTNMRSMMPGRNDKSGIDGINIQTNEEYIDETHIYSLSNINNIDNLSALTGGKIHLQENVNFQCGSDKVTTTGISIPQEGRIAKAYDDYDLANKIQVQIRCYDDSIGKNFYDESRPTANFNARAYELDKHDPNNQPYELKSASEVYNIAKSHTNEDSDEAILKNMFYDYKNNCPATPIVDVNMYDNENFDYNIEEEIPNLKLAHKISDADGKMTIYVVNTSDPSHPVPVKNCNATFSGFQASIAPIPQPGGVTPNIVGIVAGSVLGGVSVAGITWYIVWNRRRSTKRLHPDIKKLKREGSYEE